MKKFIYSAIAFGAVVSMASCASDEPLAGASDGNITFELKLPGQPGTRFAEGTSVDRLRYSVFDTEGNHVLDGEQTWPSGSLSTTVSLNLVANQSYKVVFFADNDAATGYTYAPATAAFSVDYAQVKPNEDAYDAFYSLESVVADGNEKAVTLKRPFAQLNIGSSDLSSSAVADKGLANFSSTLTVKAQNLLSGVNFLTGEEIPQAQDVTFDLASFSSLPTDAFPVSGYSYIDMNYLLVPATDAASLLDITYEAKLNGTTINTLNLASTPARPNYRTNVYGAILTTDNAFKLTIDPAFGGNLEVATPWDGISVTMPVVDETAKTATVSKPSDFIGLAQMVNGENGQTANSFEGYTVSLATDLDFGGHEITPVAKGATRFAFMASGNAFKGVLDGQNHTVRNFTITNTENNGNVANGFICNLTGANAALKNINFENISISTSTGEQTGVVSLLTNGATVENVHVLSGTISGTEATAGIVGRVMREGTVKGCSNAATIKSTKWNVGGIVGAAYYSAVGKAMTIADCTNDGDIDGVYCVGGIVGFSCAEITGCTNNAPVSGNGNSVGGVVGEQQNGGMVSGCVNKADVTNKTASASAYGTGGIVGWVRYTGSTTYYPAKNVITVSGSHNYGSVNAPAVTGVGGIVGTWYNMGTVENCVNNAESLAGRGMIAGIVGNSQFTESTPGLDGTGKNLLLTGNTTTTTLDQMTGSMKALLVYINDASKVTLSGNTPAANQ